MIARQLDFEDDPSDDEDEGASAEEEEEEEQSSEEEAFEDAMEHLTIADEKPQAIAVAA